MEVFIIIALIITLLMFFKKEKYSKGRERMAERYFKELDKKSKRIFTQFR